MIATLIAAVVCVGAVYQLTRTLRPLIDFGRDVRPGGVFVTVNNKGIGPGIVKRWRYEVRLHEDHTTRWFDSIRDVIAFLAARCDAVDDRDYTLTHKSPGAALAAGSRNRVAWLSPALAARLAVFRIEVTVRGLGQLRSTTKVVEVVPTATTQRGLATLNLK